MKIHLQRFDEPHLEFGGGATGFDPRRALAVNGPFSAGRESSVVELGVVASSRAAADQICRWVETMNGFLVATEGNLRRFRDFPGAESAFRCTYRTPDKFVRIVDSDMLQRGLEHLSSGNAKRGFDLLLPLYSETVGALYADERPACILVDFPEPLADLRVENPSLSSNERLMLARASERDSATQLSLFDQQTSSPDATAELMTVADELLFRNFHRALKARCMLLPNAVPLQVLRRHTYVEEEAKQSPATRAWNLSTALYYKSGRIPWRPHGLAARTCFIGISFHHLKKRGAAYVYASLAQAFSSDIEPFALRGAFVPHDQVRDKQPYLRTEDAERIVRRTVQEYSRRAGYPPSKVIVHKTTRYQPEEVEGFRSGLAGEVAGSNLVWFAPTGFRLLRRGTKEPHRGLLCRLDGGSNFLFTTGFVDYWDEYPGPHIPAPLQIGVDDVDTLEERAREILALTKMNWNGVDGVGRFPITITFARRVGAVMTEIGEADPNPSYRFYM